MAPKESGLPSRDDGEERYVLRLYVTGSTARSTRAIENLRRVCDERLEGRYALEVVDIYQNPQAARDQQVIAAPTLVKLLPVPVRRIIGDLSDRERVLHGLDLSSAAPASAAGDPPQEDA